ncbi:MAG: hypothetical protein ACLQF0_06865 [Dissulfurispiraceae bacterium]
MSIFVKQTKKGFTGENARDKALLKEVIGKTFFGKGGFDAVAHKATQKGYFIATSV